MIIGNGISVCDGIVIGKIFLYKKQYHETTNSIINDVDGELIRFCNAKELAITNLCSIYDKVLDTSGENEALIFEIQKMLISDSDFNDCIIEKIKMDKLNAEDAVYNAGNIFAKMFADMNDEYMSARASDIKDIANQIITVLKSSQKILDIKEPSIIVAEDLAPSETVLLDKNKILAIITTKGASNSHTAILARTMNVPAIVRADLDLNDNLHDKTIIVDGIDSKYYIEPDDDTLNIMINKKKLYQERIDNLNKFRGLEDVTLDGKEIKLYSNIGNVEDVEKVIENDSNGIGLFRSEFLFLGRDSYPTEDEQFLAYKIVASKMKGKKVIIRTLDIGADKKVDYFNLEKEENPALGFRAIRICLDRKELFKTQLRAIYRASIYGNISIMFPMIISVEEVIRIKEIINEVKEELTLKNIEFNDIELGIMIETPASVMISDELARLVDFFSVGTNDLIQYTLALDRQNEKLEKYFNKNYTAIIKMLDIVVKNAHENGIWAGICGELASELSMTEVFLKMGYDELSVNPSKTLQLRKIIRETNT